MGEFFVPEEVFLRSTYLMNGDSFAGLERYETMPVRKWLKLLATHNQVTEDRNLAMQEAMKKK